MAEHLVKTYSCDRCGNAVPAPTDRRSSLHAQLYAREDAPIRVFAMDDLCGHCVEATINFLTRRR